MSRYTEGARLLSHRSQEQESRLPHSQGWVRHSQLEHYLLTQSMLGQEIRVVVHNKALGNECCLQLTTPGGILSA